MRKRPFVRCITHRHPVETESEFSTALPVTLPTHTQHLCEKNYAFKNAVMYT